MTRMISLPGKPTYTPPNSPTDSDSASGNFDLIGDQRASRHTNSIRRVHHQQDDQSYWQCSDYSNNYSYHYPVSISDADTQWHEHARRCALRKRQLHDFGDSHCQSNVFIDRIGDHEANDHGLCNARWNSDTKLQPDSYPDCCSNSNHHHQRNTAYKDPRIRCRPSVSPLADTD